MLKIGTFSKVCQVTIKSLRHWDQIGLLKPAYTDPFTSYRYYTVEQIGTVNRILALKAMGLSLEQVTEMIQETLSPEDMRRMLKMRQMQVQREIEAANARLMFIESRLKQIDHEGALPSYETVLKPIEAQSIYATRQVFSNFDALVDLLAKTDALAQQRNDPRLLAVFHDEGYAMEHVDVEVGFSADSAAPETDDLRLTLTELPALEMVASTVHTGEWITLSQGYVYLGQWIENNGYEIVGVGREVFHHIDWHHEHRATVTEIQFPIQKRSEPAETSINL